VLNFAYTFNAVVLLAGLYKEHLTCKKSRFGKYLRVFPASIPIFWRHGHCDHEM